MNTTKIKIIQNIINSYYKKDKRLLPWRVSKGKLQNPYKTLVSEIMLQQTRVSTVKEYFTKFIKQFPNLKKLASASQENVLKAWSGMGYYRRAINLHVTSKIILDKFNGQIPNQKKLLITLPGIGEYTSSSIASFAFGKEEVPIDTNIERFVNRIFNIKEANINKKNTKLFAEKIFPKTSRGNFAQAIMDFSNEYCLKIKPKCNNCLLAKHCNYKNILKTKILKKKKKVKFCISYFICDQNKNFFIRKRDINEILGGMYEIPSTEWSTNKEQSNTILLLKNKNSTITLKKEVKHIFSHFILFTKIIVLRKDNIRKLYIKGKWVNTSTLQNLPLSSLARKVINYSLEET